MRGSEGGGEGICAQKDAHFCVACARFPKVLVEDEEPTADSEELEHRDGEEGAVRLWYLIEPIEAVAETANPRPGDVRQASVGRGGNYPRARK